MHLCCNFEHIIKMSYHFKSYDNVIQFSLDLYTLQIDKILHFCMQMITQMNATVKSIIEIQYFDEI